MLSDEEKQVVSWDFNDSLHKHSGSEYTEQTLKLAAKNWTSFMGNSAEFVDLIHFSESKASFGWCSLARIGRNRCFSLQHPETWASCCIDLILVIDLHLKRQSVLSVSFSGYASFEYLMMIAFVAAVSFLRPQKWMREKEWVEFNAG